ncbi:MAG: zinc ABC transporter substrate-binding protein [Candidatus Latescibacteria bacterium]|nr:zinc ABC transporter substrate-binding protein [Candidatus Latescibacterota bacterium]
MKNKFYIIFILIPCLLAFAAIAKEKAGIINTPNDRIEIVCTTTSLSSVFNAVGGKFVETHTIIPYGMCPGHFDLSPGEARNLLETRLLLHHGYEQFLKKIDFGDRNNKIKVDIPGNWMIPDNQILATWQIVEILSDIKPSLGDTFSARASDYVAAVLAAQDSLRNCLSVYSDIPVVCSGMNRDFVEWAGLNVLATYPRDEDISINAMHNIIVKGRDSGVRLVIDNKQSSGKIGLTIADNLKVPQIILTNFPDTDIDQDAGYPYIRTLTENCASIIEILQYDRQANSYGIP